MPKENLDFCLIMKHLNTVKKGKYFLIQQGVSRNLLNTHFRVVTFSKKFLLSIENSGANILLMVFLKQRFLVLNIIFGKKIRV